MAINFNKNYSLPRDPCVNNNHEQASVRFNGEGELSCHGYWTIDAISKVVQALATLDKSSHPVTTMNAAEIVNLDTAGALLLQDFAAAVGSHDQPVVVTGLQAHHQQLFNIVLAELPKVHEPKTMPALFNGFHYIGEWAVKKIDEINNGLAFAGEIAVSLVSAGFKPSITQLRSVIAVMDDTGYAALPIIALMVFLIGVVLGYQLSTQLKLYGADIYIIDISGVAILREFAPLITAVVIAGRTSTSFAALIGTMKVNEELDVLRTMGVTPIARLVLPRVLGLVLALPLVTVWADIFGILGAMVMSKSMLGISYYGYLARFQHVVGIEQYVLGLVKTPVFAVIIALVGCYQGFQTELNADSVGRQTTRASVQSIFLIIIADAAFSVLFNWMGY